MMATLLFISSIVCICLGSPSYALPFAILCVAFVLDDMRKQMKEAHEFRVAEKTKNSRF
jgi:hypothetical protein